MTREDKKLLQDFLTSGVLSRLSCGDLKRVIKAASDTRKRKFPRNHSRKLYGNLARNYDEQEWERFIKHVDNPKARLAYQSEHYGGLRAGEVIMMKLEHIDFLKRELIVKTEKTGLVDTIPICDPWWLLLRDWVNQHHKAILSHDGHVFFSDNPSASRDHLSEHWLRRYGADCRKAAGLDQVYGIAKGNKRQQQRKLYRLTPNHGHRHSFGTNIWEATRDMKLTQVSLRHTDIKSTGIYVHPRPSMVRDAIMHAYPSPAHEVDLPADSAFVLQQHNRGA